MSCVFCKREVNTREHHIVPRCKKGKITVSSCESCEHFIHSTWTHNELRDIYNSVDIILKDVKFNTFLKWLLKQKPDVVFKSDLNKNRKNKNKYK
jgi:Uma2 family endonuclease